jgi:predicted ATPase
VFMDVESIEAGADFTEAIARAIDDSDAVMVVIGPGWLDAIGPDGRRRLDDSGDFVRIEIEASLRSDTRVVPVLVGGARMPSEDELPAPIAALARRNAVELLDRRWREDVDALVDVLEGRGKAVVGNLPVQPTPFLGREREVAEVIGLLRRQDIRLLTLTGPGGIGKTRLAIQASTKLANTYPGGAWFVGLAALTDPELVLAELAVVLDVQEGGAGSLVDALAARLSRARTLVVLDNLEQLLPEAAGPIAELSAAAHTLDLVASSREPLHLAAEREYPVGTLPDDEALTLFVERARRVRSDFVLRDDSERQAIAQICATLDNLPLAIELAAARIKLLPPAKLLERVEQRLPLLTGGARDAPARQRTLRATIAWSYDLLSEDERQVFERLAVFAGGCTLEAAEAVTGVDLDTLQALVERNLVRTQDEPGGEPRYVMLETIREFALERIEERPDVDDLRRLHAEHFAAVARVAEVEMKLPNRQRWIDRLDAEHDNHRAALRWALDGADPDLGLGLAARLWLVWWLRRPLSEARRWLAEALDRTPPVASDVRALALDAAGFFAVQQGEDGTALLEEGIRCAREAGALSIQALATTNLSGALPSARRDEIVPLAQEGVRLARLSGDRWILSVTLNNLGEAHRTAGDLGSATLAYDESLTLGREGGNSPLVALVLTNLAEIAMVSNECSRAEELSRMALELAEREGDRNHVSGALTVLGWAALGEGLLDRAVGHFREALVLLSDLGQALWAVNVLHGLAGVAAGAGDAIRAARLEAVAARSDQILGHAPSAADSGIHTRYLDELRASTSSSVWEAAADEGEAMSLEDGIAYALSE